MTSKQILLAAAAMSLFSVGAAQAKGYIATVGVRATSRPPYEGADHNVTQPAPILSLRPADRPYRFTPPDGGATIALFDSDHFSLGPILRVRYKREDTGDLRGLDRANGPPSRASSPRSGRPSGCAGAPSCAAASAATRARSPTSAATWSIPGPSGTSRSGPAWAGATASTWTPISASRRWRRRAAR